jgi:hypothetical protein
MKDEQEGTYRVLWLEEQSQQFPTAKVHIVR